MRRYAYSFNVFRHLMHGWVPEYQKVSAGIVSEKAGQLLIWRNQIQDGYKIGAGYQDRPLDLSNYLLLRSRMHLLMQNRVSGRIANKEGVLASARSWLYKDAFADGLKAVRLDISNGLEDLHRIFVVDNKAPDYPVAFATNCMYVLAREDGRSQQSRDIIEQTLLPVVKAKAAYLHAEGLAQVAYALNEQQIWDEEVWGLIKEAVPRHPYDCTYVRNDRWSLKFFVVHSGHEHFMQKDINRFGQQLFYKENLNLFELYNSLLAAHEKQPALGLGDTIAHLKETYSEALSENRAYLELDQSRHQSSPAAAQLEE